MRSSSSLLAILILLTSGADCQEDTEASLEELVYDYYAEGWEQTTQSRLQDGDTQDGGVILLENPNLQEDFSLSTDMQDANTPAKDEFGTTLSGMMGALAEIQRKGDSMLAGIRRQRQVLSALETRAAEAERRRQEEEVIILLLEEEKEELEQHLGAMKDQEKELERAQSALEPLLSEVSTRTSELRNFDSAISAKKTELETVTRKVAEVTESLSDLETKAGAVSSTSPALLALLAGSIMFNLFAGSQLAGSLQREDTDSLAGQVAPLKEELNSFLSALGKQGENKRRQLRNKQETRNRARDKLVGKAEKRLKEKMSDVPEKKRFQSVFPEEIYYDLPRKL